MKDNICYLDEQNVLYPAGHNIVIFNTEQKTQKFIPGTENTEGITAMTVSPNHKYVAVAERAKEGEKATVTIFDLHTLKRRKVRARPHRLRRGAAALRTLRCPPPPLHPPPTQPFAPPRPSACTPPPRLSRQVLQAVSADVQSREFVSLAFSPDSKSLLTHGGAPDWSLVYWLWEKAKVGAVAKTSNPQNNPIYQCSFNPIDNTVSRGGRGPSGAPRR